MTIRSRLTRWFTGIVSVLLLVFCLVLYGIAEQLREREYRERLRQEALTSVDLLFGRETISLALFKLLDKNKLTVLNEEEIIIYDYKNQIRYESGTDYLAVDRAMLNRVRLEKEVHWREGDREIVGTVFADRFNRFVVFASAIDKYGYNKQRSLSILLVLGWLLATVATFGAGHFFAGRSLQPLRRIIGRIDGITAAQLTQRLPTSPDQDEIDQLSDRFNQMLDRLEASFKTQQAFVSHASHELRTPLTAMSGQLEVSLMAENTEAEWRETLTSVLEDVRELTRLTNGLLALAKISVDGPAIRMAPLALDELVWKVRADLLRLHPHYQVLVTMGETDVPEPRSDWTLIASEALLYTVLLNLLENGCKFSPDHLVRVLLSHRPDALAIQVNNRGREMPVPELAQLFTPFWRGSNAQGIPGHGVGLSLTQRIIERHKGRIEVESDTDHGTTFTVTLPRQPDRAAQQIAF